MAAVIDEDISNVDIGKQVHITGTATEVFQELTKATTGTSAGYEYNQQCRNLFIVYNGTNVSAYYERP